MWRAFFYGSLAAATAVIQVSFLSQLSFPFSALSFPIVAIVFGIVRDRPLLSVGWALAAGFVLDLYGLLGFGAETFSLFVTFFAVRFLFQRVLTNAGKLAFFLLAMAGAVVHWFTLSAIDGMNVLFGGVPVLIDMSFASVFAPVRQGLVAGATLLLWIGAGELLRGRYRKTFLSHAPNAFS